MISTHSAEGDIAVDVLSEREVVGALEAGPQVVDVRDVDLDIARVGVAAVAHGHRQLELKII